MKVFYSWQADTPNNVGRSFLRDVLKAALDSLEIDDASRPELDQDTAGVLGSPAIAETIFKKIGDAKVVVADVTLTGQTPNGKRTINSNVAIELGYALGVHSDQVLLKVMNTHFGEPADLPFDLLHRRWPVRFALAPDAPKEERDKVRKRLTAELSAIFQGYVDALRPRPEPFERTESTVHRGAYWNDGEPLVTAPSHAPDSRVVPPIHSTTPLLYLRMWPTEKISPAELLDDHSKTSLEPLGGTITGFNRDRNRFGILTYELGGQSTLLNSTQLFRNGEIWGVNIVLLRDRQGFPRFVPAIAAEKKVLRSLRIYADAAFNVLGYGKDANVECGMVNVANFSLAVGNHEFEGPIFEDFHVQTTIAAGSAGSCHDVALAVSRSIFKAAGLAPPKDLTG